jgi:RNA polymerase sigma factor (sigma-70 family)
LSGVLETVATSGLYSEKVQARCIPNLPRYSCSRVLDSGQDSPWKSWLLPGMLSLPTHRRSGALVLPRQRDNPGWARGVRMKDDDVNREPEQVKASGQESPGRAGHPDDQLVREFLLGRTRAVMHVEAWIRRVVRFRGYYVRYQDRRDLVQQVLLELCEALARPEFVLTSGFAPFVRSLAHRRCVDWIRHRRAPGPLDKAIPSVALSPDEKLLERELAELARGILEKLQEPCRDLIRLHVMETLSYRQIAEKLGRSEGALRTQMCECLKTAREILRRSEIRPKPTFTKHRSPP